MNLSSGLPYTADVYAILMADYNEAWVSLNALSLFCGFFIIHMSRRHPLPAPSRVKAIGIILVAMAAFVGAAHQWLLMAPLNFMGSAYAAGWGLCALWLFLRFSVFAPDPKRPVFWADRALGQAMMALALVPYPAMQWAMGRFGHLVGMDGSPGGVEYFGTSPNPTALFIMGAVLSYTGRQRLDLLVLPALWAGVAGLHAYLLHQPTHYILPISVLLLPLFLLATRKKAAQSGS